MKNLIYYYWPQCHFCQRVTICLEEKNIKHDDEVINLLKYENFNPEFVKKNPLCLVPVIQDSGTTVCESDKIIDYLEKYEPKLYPEKSNKNEWDEVQKFKDLIMNMPISQIYFGCISPDCKNNMKMDKDFIEKSLSAAKCKPDYLEVMAGKYPEFKEIYEKKRDSARQLDIVKMSKDMEKNIVEIRRGLEQIEEQLKKMSLEKKGWLCTDFFSVADIYLCNVLHRIDVCGLNDHFWTNSDHPLPHIAKYFKKGMEWPSVKKMIPQYKMDVLGTK